MVLSFDDYIRALSDEEVAEFLGNGEDVAEFRDMINGGVDAWLDGCAVKTLCLR